MFSAMISQAVSNSSLVGINIRQQSPTLSYLFFAYDSMLFLKADSKNCMALLGLLHSYRISSRHNVNFAKLGIYFTKGTKVETMNLILTLLRVQPLNQSEK